MTVNLGLHSGVPNLFGLPAPVYVGTVPGGTPSTGRTAAARARSAPVARVDNSGSDTALQGQRLANYEARLRQEGSFSLVTNAMIGTSVLHSTEHIQVAQPGTDGTCNPLLMRVPSSPWTRHQERAHKLSAYAQ